MNELYIQSLSIDWNRNDVRIISFENLAVGDEVILNIYDSELQKETIMADAIVVEQIQLGTQRM